MPILTYITVANGVITPHTQNFAGYPRARLGDVISHGAVNGAITSNVVGIIVDGSPAAAVGCLGECNIHGTVTIVTGSSTHFSDSAGTARLNDKMSCGAVIVTAAYNVLIM